MNGPPVEEEDSLGVAAEEAALIEIVCHVLVWALRLVLSCHARRSATATLLTSGPTDECYCYF